MIALFKETVNQCSAHYFHISISIYKFRIDWYIFSSVCPSISISILLYIFMECHPSDHLYQSLSFWPSLLISIFLPFLSIPILLTISIKLCLSAISIILIFTLLSISIFFNFLSISVHMYLSLSVHNYLSQSKSLISSYPFQFAYSVSVYSCGPF